VIASIEQALDKDPGKRFPDVAAFVSALTGSTLPQFHPSMSAPGMAPATATAAPSSHSGGASTTGTGDRGPAGILFGDLKGSTHEAELDEQSSVEKLREYERIVSQTAASFGPNFYKVRNEGDGFMAIFTTAHAMVECGFTVQQEFRRRGWQVRLGGG